MGVLQRSGFQYKTSRQKRERGPPLPLSRLSKSTLGVTHLRDTIAIHLIVKSGERSTPCGCLTDKPSRYMITLMLKGVTLFHGQETGEYVIEFA